MVQAEPFYRLITTPSSTVNKEPGVFRYLASISCAHGYLGQAAVTGVDNCRDH